MADLFMISAPMKPMNNVTINVIFDVSSIRLKSEGSTVLCILIILNYSLFKNGNKLYVMEIHPCAKYACSRLNEFDVT